MWDIRREGERRAKLSFAMSLNIDNDVVDVISCAALVYERKNSGNSFLHGLSFDCFV